MNESGFDREALSFMITRCIHGSNDPKEEIKYFKDLLDDINIVVINQVNVFEEITQM